MKMREPMMYTIKHTDPFLLLTQVEFSVRNGKIKKKRGRQKISKYARMRASLLALRFGVRG